MREKPDNLTVGISENMIKFESCFNMNRNPSERHAQRKSIDNQNNPGSVPFRINSSQLSLNVGNRARNEMERHHNENGGQGKFLGIVGGDLF